MPLPVLITDRTKADVDQVSELRVIILKVGFAGLTPPEQSFWLSHPKGAYNATDLNRVGEAMEYVGARFRAYGYAAAISPKTDWAMTDIPTEADMDQYLGDLRTLRNVFAVLSTTPPVPGDMERLWWHEANDIEQILVDIDLLLTSLSQVFIRAGMPWAVAGNQIYAAN